MLEKGPETSRPGPDPGFGFGGGQVERRRRKGRGVEGAESTWGGVWRVGVPLRIGSGIWGGGGAPQNFFSFLGLKMRILVRSPAHLECLFLQCNTFRSRPALRLPTLTFQADCGSIKGAGVLQVVNT